MRLLPVLAAIVVGALTALGGYTFSYAKGFSYVSNDPAVCANCHIMENHVRAWVKSSHHTVAVCNDCHTPPGLVGKYATKALNDKMQAIEAEADRQILELYRESYTRETDPMRYLILKDLFEILEKAIDRCRDAGNVVYQIVLKNA